MFRKLSSIHIVYDIKLPEKLHFFLEVFVSSSTDCNLRFFPFYWQLTRIYFYDINYFTAPSRPRNVRILAITDTSIEISWWEPARANGVLQGYRIYMLHQNFTSVQTVRSNKSSIVETLTRLSKSFNFHHQHGCFLQNVNRECSAHIKIFNLQKNLTNCSSRHTIRRRFFRHWNIKNS